jgi:hypothetical protein
LFQLWGYSLLLQLRLKVMAQAVERATPHCEVVVVGYVTSGFGLVDAAWGDA